ncbi:hypothetical protein DL96DRAFT_881993 [Flagelloscypha sp. PMI_526]|nr:hypothetical protein DL96DRAFT_881993 [Flagelloscypha sp. PMI_526]
MEVQDQFMDYFIAVIVSIGAGHSAHVSLDDSNGFEQTAAKLATSCHEVAERFEKALPSEMGVFARFDANGFDVSGELSGDDVMTHTNSYLGRGDVKDKLDIIATRLRARPRLIKAVEISVPSAVKLEPFRESMNLIPKIPSALSELREKIQQLTHLTKTHDDDGYLYVFREHINCVKPIRSYARGGIQSFIAKQTTGESILLHKFGDRQQMEEHIKREKSHQWSEWFSHFVGYSITGDPFLVMRTNCTFDTITRRLSESDTKKLMNLKFTQVVYGLPPGITIPDGLSLGSLLRQPCFRESGELSLDIPLLISQGILSESGYKPSLRTWMNYVDRAQMRSKSERGVVLEVEKNLQRFLVVPF